MDPDSIPYPDRLITRSEEETLDAGRRCGSRLSVPAVILLEGELGTGKTVFVRGLAAGLGIDPGVVSSPSFTLINLYRGPVNLYHIDLYRIAEGVPIDEQLGLREILSESAVVAVEWPDRLRPGLRDHGLLVRFRWLSNNSREISTEMIP